MSVDSDYDKVVEFLKTLGVEVVEVAPRNQWWPNTQAASFREAPFTSNLGIDLKSYQILFAGAKHPWPHLVHEAGHLLATKLPPENSKEISFLGWEISVVKHLSLSMDYWVKNNSDYSIQLERGSEFYDDIGHLARVKDDFDWYLNERIDYAKKNSMVSEDGVPLVVRKRRSTHAIEERV